MATTETKKMDPKRARRRQVAILAGVAVPLFVAGYGIGWWHANVPTTHEPEGAFSADIGPGGGPSQASLADLLPGLESKVAANPRDASQRMLLAQTYLETGQQDKGIDQLRVLRKQNPADAEASILLATALLERGTVADLAEADKLLEATARNKPAVLPMVRLYQGEIRIKQGDRAGAVRIWKDYLAQMPAGDPRRALYEQRIAETGSRS